MAKKKQNKNTQKSSSIKVSDKLKEFDIQINSLGEIISNYDIDKINEFLNKNVDDKKLSNREDNLLEELRKKAQNEDEAGKDDSQKDTE